MQIALQLTPRRYAEHGRGVKRPSVVAERARTSGVVAVREALGSRPVDDVASAGGGWTRRRLLSAAGLAVLGAAVQRAPVARATVRYADVETAGIADVRHFVTRRDLSPLAVDVAMPARRTAPGYVFAAPFIGPGQYGPLIMDNRGEPVWFRPNAKPTAMDFRVQRYRGEDVLTWWEGKVGNGYGGGRGMIVDRTYRPIAVVRAGNGYDSDLHEFLITSRNTAIVAIFSDRQADASSVGGPTDARVVEGIVQELDVRSGHVLFEWHSLDHVPLAESVLSYGAEMGAFDYFHLNSIGVDTDGNLLVSARHTSTVYKVDRRTGDVVWRLGGKKSDFSIGSGAAFNFQHDARGHQDGTLTLFDNGAFAPPPASPVEQASRPLRLALDATAMTARLVAVYEAPDPRQAFALGDVQQLPDGGVFVGWGTAGAFTEFTPGGRVRFDAKFAPGGMSYRVFRSPWTGRPRTLPDVAVRHVPAGKTTVYASWNGATEVARWRVEAGANARALRPLRTVRRSGFETAIAIPRVAGVVAVSALDRHGAVLATSKHVKA